MPQDSKWFNGPTFVEMDLTCGTSTNFSIGVSKMLTWWTHLKSWNVEHVWDVRNAYQRFEHFQHFERAQHPKMLSSLNRSIFQICGLKMFISFQFSTKGAKMWNNFSILSRCISNVEMFKMCGMSEMFSNCWEASRSCQTCSTSPHFKYADLKCLSCSAL